MAPTVLGGTYGVAQIRVPVRLSDIRRGKNTYVTRSGSVREKPMITMTNESEETFIYEPMSFAANNPNVNPDSPRHFKTKRRRNLAAPKLKRRPQSLVDFRAINQKKEQESFANKRSKTLIERCRVVLQRTISMDGLLGIEENDKNSLEETSSNYSKPITSRYKVREIRKVNSGKLEDEQPGKPNLTRSKSDGSVYCSPEGKSCNGNTKTRNSDYTETCSLKNLVCYDEYYKFLEEKVSNSLDSFKASNSFDSFKAKDSNSLDSFKTKSDSSTSSPNSSGFCDYTGTESDNLSSDCVSLVASDSSFYGKHNCSQENVYDQDKLAEEKLYSRSLEKNRRPQSIKRNRNEHSINDSVSPSCSLPISTNGSVSPSGSLPTMDDVFMIDDITNDKFLSENIKKQTIVTPTTPSSKKINKSKERGSSPNRKTESDRSKGKKHKKTRQTRPKSMVDYTYENNTDSKNKEPHSDNVTIEDAVEGLTITPKKVQLSSSDRSIKNKNEKRKKYKRETSGSLPNIFDTRSSSISFPVVKQRNLFNSGRCIRIESVV